jgi:hypothetical protein
MLLSSRRPDVIESLQLGFGLLRGLWLLAFNILAFMLPLGAIWGILKGLSGSEIEKKDTPNQGIHRSARLALMSWLISGLIYGTFSVLAAAMQPPGLLLWGMLSGDSSPDLILFAILFIAALLGGLFYGLPFGLHAGGRTCLQHLVLRLSLTRNGSMPWRYADFLDFAAERLFLLKSGGGYSFFHRLLQDYFAARYMELDRGSPQENVSEEPTPSRDPEAGGLASS